MFKESKYLSISARFCSGAPTTLGRAERGGGKITRIGWAILLGIMLSVCTTPAFSVDGDPPGLFEMDGDPHDKNGLPLPDEWDTLYLLDPNNGGAGFGGAPIAFTGILADPAPASIYWKGGSKDVQDIPNWWHKDGSVPDKDDITNAYAAGYLIPENVCLDVNGDPILCSDGAAVSGPVHFTDDLIIYFGLDRYDNSGDAFAAFWFLQDKVTKNDGTSKFDGAHVAKTVTDPGDFMVLVEYPQGSNATPVIKVYEWDPDLVGAPNLDENNKDLGPLEMIFRSEDALCDGAGDKVACAITNVVDVSAPDWDYTPKGGSLGDDLPFETFYEGGINVTRLLGGANICISTFLAETRSSRSETAQLKDLVIGGFPVCSSEISTNVHNDAHEPITFTTVKPGTIHDFAEVTATGPGLSTDPTGTVDFYLYVGGSCEGTLFDSDLNVPLEGGTPGDATASAESKDYDLSVGTWSFIAVYKSDTPDFPGATDEVCEVFTIEKYDSKIETEIHESGGHSPDIQNTEVFVGLTIHDHAFVAEKNNDGNAPTPTGTVMFKRYSNLTCTGTSVDATVGINGGGEAETGNFVPLGDSFLSYSASYSGDANYNAATDVVCEKLTINKYPSKVETSIHEGSAHGADIQGNTVNIGLTVHDHAYVSADGTFTSPPAPTGNVTFYIYRDTACADGPIASYGGETWPQIDGVDGSGEAETVVFTPSVGAFGILVSYAGDANYKSSDLALSDCEDLTVNKVDPTIVTKVIVRDWAEVTGALAVAPTGDVTFKTYRSNDCSGPAVDTVIRPLSGSGTAEQLAVSEQLLEVAAGVASYVATYEGDGNYNAKTHACEVVQFSVP